MDTSESQTHANCPACGSVSLKPAFSDNTPYMRCQQCHLAFVQPPPLAEALRTRADYWAQQHHLSHEKLRRQFSPRHQRIAYGPLLHLLVPYQRSSRLLEVGCAAGAFLDAARNHGWQVKGVEIAAASAEYARQKRGLDVITGTLADLPLENRGTYDAIVALDVIEHLDDPCSFVRQCAEFLQPRGALMLLTPNVRSLSARVLGGAWEAVEPEDHPWLFSPAALHSILIQAGFAPRHTQTLDCNPIALAQGLIQGGRRIFKARDFTPEQALRKRLAMNQARSHFIQAVESLPILPTARYMVNLALSAMQAGDKLLVLAIKLSG